MRAKKAKLLRKYANMAKTPKETSYQHIQHKPKSVWNGKLNEDGTKQFVKVVPITVVLDECARSLYQQLKRFRKV